MADVDLGTDFACVEDLDFNLSTVTGRLGVAHSVARRLDTPRGGLWYDEDYGYAIRQHLNAPAQQASSIAASVEDEAQKDERVLAAKATVSLFGTPQKLTVDLEVETAEGPFELVLLASALTVDMISFNET